MPIKLQWLKFISAKHGLRMLEVLIGSIIYFKVKPDSEHMNSLVPSGINGVSVFVLAVVISLIC